MSRMTLGQLKDKVLPIIGGTFDADIVRHINHALLQLSTDSEILRRNDVAVSNGEAAIPTDCMAIKDVYINNVRLNKYAESNIPGADAVSSSYFDTHSWLIDFDNNIVKIIPAPDVTTAQLVYRIRENTLMQDNDTHSLSDADEFIVAYAAYKALIERDGITDEAMYWKEEAASEKKAWLKRNNQQVSRGRFVRPRAYI